MFECNQTSFIFPLLADIYYPMITQGQYNEIEKEWVFDRTVACYVESDTARSNKEEIRPGNLSKNDQMIIARTKEDIRFSSLEDADATANILIGNIRFPNGEVVYTETGGPRDGRGTMFEIAKFNPIIGPFSSVEYFSMIWKRAESQAIRD